MPPIVITTQEANGKGVRLSFPTLSRGIKPAVAITMTPEITRETFEKGPGQQTGLTDIDDCVHTHDELREEYGLGQCPNCGRTIEKPPESASNREQKALTDF